MLPLSFVTRPLKIPAIPPEFVTASVNVVPLAPVSTFIEPWLFT